MKISYIVTAIDLALYTGDDKFLFEFVLEDLGLLQATIITEFLLRKNWKIKDVSNVQKSGGGIVYQDKQISIKVQPVLDVDGTFFKLEEVKMRTK